MSLESFHRLTELGKGSMAMGQQELAKQDKECAFFFYKQGLQYWINARNELKKLSAQEAPRQRYAIMINAFDTKISEFMNIAEMLQADLGLSSTTSVSSSNSSRPQIGAEESGGSHSSLFKKSFRPVHWKDIGGLQVAVQALREAVQFPRDSPHLFTYIKPDRIILLYGPPGTGKTYLAQAVATEMNAPFAKIMPADVLDKYLGESEKAMRDIFEEAKKQQPCVIFFDEVDGIASSRTDGEQSHSRNIKNEFLIQLQDILDEDHRITVLMATNLPHQLDDALRRRTQKRIYIGLPDHSTRCELLRIYIYVDPNATMTKEDIEQIADSTEGFSGSDIRMFVQEAGKQALRKTITGTHFKAVSDSKWVRCESTDVGAKAMPIETILKDLILHPLQLIHFQAALLIFKATCSSAQLDMYEEWTRQFGQEG